MMSISRVVAKRFEAVKDFGGRCVVLTLTPGRVETVEEPLDITSSQSDQSVTVVGDIS